MEHAGRDDHRCLQLRVRLEPALGVTTDATPSRSFTSDAAGNIIEDTDLSTSTTKALSHNHPGQLAGVEVGGTPQGVYQYDYLSRLVSRGLPGSYRPNHNFFGA